MKKRGAAAHWRGLSALAAAYLLAAGAPASAAVKGAMGLPSLSSAFVQVGAAQGARMIIAGATWDWEWRRDLAAGLASGYWEASFGRWSSDGAQGGHAWVAQLGVTPVLRLYPHAWGGRWFVEAGVGANLLLPVYNSRTKRFSTAFNFGDHLAIGRRFGEDDRHEVALRIQHFSNAGIREPNPGEDFVQVRYSRRF